MARRMRITFHLVSGTELSHEQEVTEDTAREVDLPLDKITGELMAEKMNEMFQQMADQNVKLTRLTVGNHFVRVEHLAAITYKVWEASEYDPQ
jgi:hypothetical protein